MSLRIASHWTARIGRIPFRVYVLVEQLGRGNSRYFFLAVEPEREQEFLNVLNGNARIRLSDLGRILATGYGAPPPEVEAAIKAGRISIS